MSDTTRVILRFSVTIDAPVAVVWDTMIEQESYKQWTATFDPTSYYEGSWEQGSSIKFLSKDNMGMIGTIAVNKPYQYISIVYEGYIKDNTLDTESEGSKAMKGAEENYTFASVSDTITRLDIETATNTEMAEWIRDLWPKALQTLKELCESK
jgi:uncharacterized protein YndB with AHSA1/START domain